MKAPRDRELWREATLVLCAVLLTLGGAWITAPRAGLGREDVKEIVRTESPYVADRSVIRFQLAQLNAKVDRLLELELRGRDRRR